MQSRFLDGKILMLLAVAGLALSAQKAAGAEDGGSANWVMHGCRSILQHPHSREIFRGGLCYGAVGTALDLAAGSLGVICPPPSVTTAQAVRVVTQYIEARPARMHERFASLSLEALQAAWPCPAR